MKVFQNPTGNSAEDEQNNKRHARRYRVYLIILAVFVAFLVILATVLTPMLVLQRQDSNAEKKYRAEENNLANNFTTEFRDAVLNAFSAVYGVQGYIMGEMKTLPNITASKEERVKGQYFPSFDRYAALVNSSAASIAVFLTAPGGVTYQFYPDSYGVNLSDWDLLDTGGYGPDGNWSDPAEQRPSSWSSVETGKLVITGPYSTTGLPFVENRPKTTSSTPPPSTLPKHETTQSSQKQQMLPTTTTTSGPKSTQVDDAAWWIDLQQPVYKATEGVEVSPDTFWGFAMAALSIDNLFEVNHFVETMNAYHMNYTVYTNTSSKKCIVMLSSWKGVSDCSQGHMQDFINSATVHDVLGDQIAWKVAVKSALRENRLTPHVRTAIVVSSVLGTIILFIFVVYVIILCTRVYDGTVHAPKMAPFAMLTVGPCRGEELWELASDQMVEVKERLGRVLARQMVRHHAYQIQQVHPLTTSYVTRGVAAAVQMAFDTIEELQSSPIDDALRRLLGDDGCLLLSYAVHWCTDAVVRPEHVGGGYRYEGPDMVYGGRMWVFAAPNVVTVSPPALAGAKRIPHVRHKLFDSVFLRGVTDRQNLYVVWDPNNPKLQEAEDFAAEQVKRARQAQREMAASKTSEPDAYKRRLTYSFNPTGYDSSDPELGSFAARPRHANNNNINNNSTSGWGTSSTSNSNSNNDSSSNSTPSSVLRSRTNIAKVLRRDGSNVATTAAAAATPTAVMVPASSPHGPLPISPASHNVHAVAANPCSNPLAPACPAEPSSGTASVTSKSTKPPSQQSQERRMVRRPTACSATNSDTDGEGEDDDNNTTGPSSDAEEDEGKENAVAGNKMTDLFVEGHSDSGEQTRYGDAAPPPQQPPTQVSRLLTVPCGGCASPLPALPPIGSTPRPVLTATQTSVPVTAVIGHAANVVHTPAPTPPPSAPPAMSSRRVLDALYSGVPGPAAITAAAAVTAATTVNGGGPRHGDAASSKPLVMVPPSAELAAAAASNGSSSNTTTHTTTNNLNVGGCGGGVVGGTGANTIGIHVVPSKSSSTTPSSDSTGHGRRAIVGPASSYDNPLAHNLTTVPTSSGVAQAGASHDCHNASTGNPSAPLVAVTSFASDGDPLANSEVSLDTFSSDLLLRPAITVQADHLLRTVFDRQAVALDVSYDSVRVLVYYFYSSYKILFRPLAAPERHNIYRRLMAAFGVPQQGILEHLAARCAIRFLQRHEETQTLLWDQQRRLQVHARSGSGATASASDEANGGSSN